MFILWVFPPCFIPLHQGKFLVHGKPTVHSNKAGCDSIPDSLSRHFEHMKATDKKHNEASLPDYPG